MCVLKPFLVTSQISLVICAAAKPCPLLFLKLILKNCWPSYPYVQSSEYNSQRNYVYLPRQDKEHCLVCLDDVLMISRFMMIRTVIDVQNRAFSLWIIIWTWKIFQMQWQVLRRLFFDTLHSNLVSYCSYKLYSNPLAILDGFETRKQTYVSDVTLYSLTFNPKRFKKVQVPTMFVYEMISVSP